MFQKLFKQIIAWLASQVQQSAPSKTMPAIYADKKNISATNTVPLIYADMQNNKTQKETLPPCVHYAGKTSGYKYKIIIKDNYKKRCYGYANTLEEAKEIIATQKRKLRKSKLEKQLADMQANSIL